MPLSPGERTICVEAKSLDAGHAIVISPAPRETFGFASVGALASNGKVWPASAELPAWSRHEPTTAAFGRSGPA